MNDEPVYDEMWWERELHRNEKLMDRYLAALAENPDLARLQQPDPGPNASLADLDAVDDGASSKLDALEIERLEESRFESCDSDNDAGDPFEDIENGLENSPPDNEGYADVARLARKFAVAIASLEPRREIPQILFLSAPKIGANLAGGHGLGYDEETLCGNIVKCRWALADCEFCREMLEQLAQRTGGADYRSLASESSRLSRHIRERVARLRERVWW